MANPNGSDKARYTSSVPAVEQTARILLFLSSTPDKKANLTEICNTVGINLSKGYALLNTLQNFGMVLREPQGKVYSLGPGLILPGQRAAESIGAARLAQPYIDALSRETHSSAAFGLVAGDQYFWVAKHDIGEAVGLTLQLGFAFPILHGAHGIATLPYMSGEQQEAALAGDHHFFEGDTQYSRDRLAREMKEAGSRGYAEYRAKINPRIRILATPVFGPDGTPVGSFEIVGIFPASRTKAQGARLVAKALEFSTLFGADTLSLQGKFSDGIGSR